MTTVALPTSVGELGAGLQTGADELRKIAAVADQAGASLTYVSDAGARTRSWARRWLPVVVLGLVGTCVALVLLRRALASELDGQRDDADDRADEDDHAKT